MWDDNRVLAIYIDFVATSMSELERIVAHERVLHEQSNIFNRKKNLQSIQQEYQRYLESIHSEWGKIYKEPSHFAETLKHTGLLSMSRSVYALTINQKHVELFFYDFFDSVKAYFSSLNDDEWNKKNSWHFRQRPISLSVEHNLQRLFPLAMRLMKNNGLNMDESKKQAFVVINQKCISDVHIQYSPGEELTDMRIDQILVDFKEQEKKARQEYNKEVAKGNIRVELPTYSTIETLKRGLENESCFILTSNYGGTKVYYNTLPVLPTVSSTEMLKIQISIELHTNKMNYDPKKKFEVEAINAFYLGMAAGYAYLKSLPMNANIVIEKFLNNKVSPEDITHHVLSYMGIESGSVEVTKYKKVSSEMTDRFRSPVLETLSYYEEKDTEKRTFVAMEVAYKLGYHVYFRGNKIIPGNTFEEDQMIINQLPKKQGNQGFNPVNKSEGKLLEDKAVKTANVERQGVVSARKHQLQETKYWLDEKGIVKCPGDACPIECDTDCPIYAQTLALQKLMKNEVAAAAELLKKAVATEPKFGDAWNNLAACYGQMGDHKNAFAAYQRAYETQPKPNPLYGMAVASKNMKDYALSKVYINIYENKFGKDDRITALLAEISENELSEKINSGAKRQETKPVVQEKTEKAVETSPQFAKTSSAGNHSEECRVSGIPNMSIENMRRYGKLMLLLLDPDTREAGYAAMAKMENEFPEAGISLGQYYYGSDQEKAKKHFGIAADAGIAEGQWSYSQLLPHSDVLDLSDTDDKEYLKYCLAAAEGGCPDAANEMGNICHRKEFYAESTYWYGMAYSLEHPSGMVSLRGITKEWATRGKSKAYAPHIEGFTEDRHETTLLLYKMFNQSLEVEDMDKLMKLALGGENLAGFIIAKVFEQHQHDDMAYKVYNALAFENHPYALRCYADMLLAGKGTEKDIEAAFRMYEKAALGGNATAMFAMGQKASKAGDKNLAACWFGMALGRGMEMAGEWLSKLAEI